MKRVNGVIDLSRGYIREEATERDTYAHMEHLMNKVILMLSHKHEITNSDGSVEEVPVREVEHQ